MKTTVGRLRQALHAAQSPLPTIRAMDPVDLTPFGLPGGVVHLDAWEASDLSVVNAARVSLHKASVDVGQREDDLIHYLMANKHGTPFEHNFFRFRIKAPIFVFREWHRHRIGHSYNEWSARYSEMARDFYIPENVRVQLGKPGAYTYETLSDLDPRRVDFVESLRKHCDYSFDMYELAIAQGIAKEQARFFLNVNLFSEMFWSCNARSMMAFLELRAHEAAMWEIRQYAYTIEAFLEWLMPVTYRAFVKNGRIAP